MEWIEQREGDIGRRRRNVEKPDRELSMYAYGAITSLDSVVS
jgi:hypothetical protein